MVGHQNKTVDVYSEFLTVFEELFQKNDMVPFGIEAYLPVVTPLDDVQRNIWQKVAGVARHVESILMRNR